VDTGSPFLIVPSVCSRAWGCAPRDTVYQTAGLEDTTEIFGGQDYDAEWKSGYLGFRTQFPYRFRPTQVVFASVGLDVLRPPGGVFMGLIKQRSDRIRPTLMEQLGYSSICFNARDKYLTLSRTPLIPPSSKALPLVDLRPLGDPVCHYAVLVKSLEINGLRVGAEATIYAIFDTGCTGAVLSEALFNDENTPQPPRRARLVVEAEDGSDVVIETFATRERIFIVTCADIKWFKVPPTPPTAYASTPTPTLVSAAAPSELAPQGGEGGEDVDMRYPSSESVTGTQIVVVGLTFLRDKVLTIDIEQRRASLV